MKIIIIAGFSVSILNFRKDFVRSLVRDGHDVIAVAEEADENIKSQIESLGCSYKSIPISRSGINPINDIKTFLALKTLFKNENPDIVFAYTIKPIIWGGVASRFKNGIRFYALVTGLGYAFQPGGRLKSVLIWLVKNLYKTSLKKTKAAIFQNPDNMKVFIEHGIIPTERCHLVNGSGVDLSHFEKEPLPQESRFLLIARLLGDKGIREFAEAAELVKERYPNATFDLVGPEDPSPDGIDISEINELHDKGVINYHGATNDVRPFIKECSIFVLPSYHEGMPRTVLEAMAMGRPILTTDAPGCRETVVNGKNGWLVPIADSGALAEKMVWFIENQSLWQEMARQSYIAANEKFDVHKVNAEIMRIVELNDEKTV